MEVMLLKMLFVASGTNQSNTSLSFIFLGLKSLSCDYLNPLSQSQRHAFILLLNGLVFSVLNKAL